MLVIPGPRFGTASLRRTGPSVPTFRRWGPRRPSPCGVRPRTASSGGAAVNDGLCRCPLCVSEAVVHLLETGRPGPALLVARTLRASVLDAIETAHQGG